MLVFFFICIFFFVFSIISTFDVRSVFVVFSEKCAMFFFSFISLLLEWICETDKVQYLQRSGYIMYVHHYTLLIDISQNESGRESIRLSRSLSEDRKINAVHAHSNVYSHIPYSYFHIYRNYFSRIVYYARVIDGWPLLP